MKTKSIDEAKDLLMMQVHIAIQHMPMHKQLAVLRYMKTYISRMADYEVDEAVSIKEPDGKLSPSIQFKLEQAIKGYDNWMRKYGRSIPKTLQEKEQEQERFRAGLDELARAGSR